MSSASAASGPKSKVYGAFNTDLEPLLSRKQPKTIRKPRLYALGSLLDIPDKLKRGLLCQALGFLVDDL